MPQEMNTFVLNCVIIVQCIFLLIVLNEISCSSNAEDAIVQTKYGSLQGISLTSRRGRVYYGFLGIPYGKIPERFAVRFANY